MKLFTRLILGMIAVAAAGAMASCAQTGDTHPTAYNHGTRQGDFADARYYTPEGGWYALNYPYYYSPGPAVGGSDPYDYNGHYFQPPSTTH